MGSLTLHIDATHDWPRAAKFLAQKGVETAFLLNANPEQIQYTLDNTTGIVTVRVYDPFNERRNLGDNFEKDIVLRHTPTEFVNWLNSKDLSRFKGNQRVRFILGWNEMYYSGAEYQRRQNKAMIAVADALVKTGYGVAMFGMASDKTIQMEDVKNGVWEEVKQWVNANKDWVHLDVHEYEFGRLASQHLKSYPVPVGYPKAIEDPHSMRQENWGVIEYTGDRIAGNWHLGRVAWLGDIPYARGEMGSDYKNDGAIAAYLPSYQAKFGKPQGFPSLRPLYNHLLGKILSDKEFCEAIYQDLTWFAAQDPNCLSNAIFAWNPQPEHQPFNLAKPEFTYLLELLGQQAPMGNPPTSPPNPTPNPEIPMLDAKIRAKDVSGTNIRKAPVNGAILGKFENVWTTAKIQADYKDVAWAKVEANGVMGYSATAWLDVEIVGMEKLYTLQVGDRTLLVTKESLEDIIAYQEMLLAWLRKLNE